MPDNNEPEDINDELPEGDESGPDQTGSAEQCSVLCVRCFLLCIQANFRQDLSLFEDLTTSMPWTCRGLLAAVTLSASKPDSG